MDTQLELTDALRILEQPNGGFVDFTPQTPHLYATYYHLKTVSLPCFDQKLPHRAETTEWLQRLARKQFDVRGTTEVKLLDIYLGLKSLALLDASVAQTVTDEIIEAVETMDGAHLPIHEDDEFDSNQHDLVAVYRLLTIYDALDVPMESDDDLESWLTERWTNWQSSQLVDSMPEMLKNYRCLRLLGYDRHEIVDIWDPGDGIESSIDEFTEQSGSEGLDLLGLESTQDLATEIGMETALPESLLREFAASQNPDGGFSLMGDPISDCRGTYIVLDILSDRAELGRIDFEAAVKFVLFHVVSGGGFSLHYRQEPAIDETFAAHWLLRAANGQLDAETDLATTVPDSFYPSGAYTPKKLYKTKVIHERSGGNPPTVDVNAFVDAYLDGVQTLEIPTRDLLENVYYSCLLDREFSTESRYRDSTDDIVVEAVLATRNPNGGFGEGDTGSLQETFQAVYSLAYVGHQLSGSERTVEWVRAHRNDDGGFRQQTTDGSVSDIVSTYFAVQSLLVLGAEIDDVGAIGTWLRDFRHINGGWPKHAKDDPEIGPRLEPSVLAEDLRRRLDGLAERDVLAHQ